MTTRKSYKAVQSTSESDGRVERVIDLRPRLRIAVIGLRGIPALWGGVEHHVEELGARLTKRGHQVTVFGRRNYTEEPAGIHRGMSVRYLPAVGSKHLEAISNAVLASGSAMGGDFDVVHYHAVGPGTAATLPRVFSGKPIVLTVHGLDGEREKWGSFATRALRSASWMSARVPHETVVVSKALQSHYRDRYDRETVYIPNGMPPTDERPLGAAGRLGVRPGRYVLYVGRLVPEKAPHVLVRAFRRLPDPDLRLVLVGGSSYTDDYVEQVRGEAAGDPRIVMPGYLYGDDLAELYANAGTFVLPSRLEGLPLTLLEAIANGAPVVASDIGPHREILTGDSDGGRLVPVDDEVTLATAIQDLLAQPHRSRLGARALRRSSRARYSWERATDELETLYQDLVHRRAAGQLHRPSRSSARGQDLAPAVVR